MLLIQKSLNLNKENYRKKILPKYTCTVKFDNEVLELMQLPRFFNIPEVVFQLSDKLKQLEIKY